MRRAQQKCRRKYNLKLLELTIPHREIWEPERLFPGGILNRSPIVKRWQYEEVPACHVM